MKPEYLFRNTISYDYLPYILLPIFCYFLILPSIFIRRINLDFLFQNEKINYLILILFPFIIFSLFYLTPYTFNTFIYGAESMRAGGGSGSEYFMLPPTKLTTFAVGIAMFYPLYLFFLFQQIVTKGSKLLIIIMITGVISGIIGGLVFATRDRFIYIIFYLLLFYWLWLPYFDNHVKLIVNRTIKFSIYICFGFFSWITFDRFGDGFSEFFKSTLFYYGAQPYIFAEIYSKSQVHGLNYIFPLFFDGKGLIDKSSPEYWMWGTLFQNLFFSGGILFCIIFVLFHSIFSSTFFNYFHRLNFIYLIYLILYFQIVSHGVFYYNLGFPGGNNYLIGMIFFGIVMFFFNKAKV
ncbi:hypothetical protein HLH15_13575 [Acinetobacter sp. ANC 5084]|uniref:Oligosaccharide repeat unit polymerase n=2 Tax=Acinetobacter terrestris TaxID=2529843 RepID=A0ABX1UW77_9GAMM|nr:hypothetical protein [Acinetobacter terrestris]